MRPFDPRLLRQARTTRRYVGTVALLGAANAGLVLAQAWVIAVAITEVVIDGAGLADIGAALGWLAVIVVGRAGLAWATEVAAHRAAAGVKSELRRRLLAHVIRLGPGWLHGERTGDVVALATRGLDGLDAYVARYLPQLVLAALVPAAILAVILPVDTIAGATIGLTLPLIPIFMALIGKSTARLSQRQFAAIARLTHHLLEVLAGLATLRVFNRARAQVAAIRDLSAEQRRHGMRTLRLAFVSSLALELLATLSVALVAVGIGLRVVNGSLDLRTALVVLILAPEAYAPLRQLGAHFHAGAEGLTACARVFDILEIPAAAQGAAAAVPDLRHVPITFDAVTVRFPDRGTAALERFSLRVEPDEIVAVTGPSGSGKSTVANLLLGFVTPTAGQLRVGEVALAELDIDAWRRSISYVPQRAYLFAGTVADNIALATSTSSLDVRARVGAAAAAAGLDRLPSGLSTPVGQLSAGQRQRVALARAFLRDTPLVVLDEPTANLDSTTEAAIVHTIRQLALGRTVVVMAHRPALRALADRVVDLSPAAVAVAA